MKQGYITYDQQSKGQALANYNKSMDKFTGLITRKTETTTAASEATVLNTRAPYFSDNYYRNRPYDILPSRYRDIVYACRMSYLRVGIVRNVIDLITDFATEGLQFVHPDKKVEAFFRVWSTKAQTDEASNEFVRHFLVDGNVVVRRLMAKITEPVKNQWEQRSYADSGIDKLYKENQGRKNEIPYRYTFLNTASLYWLGGDVSRALPNRQLGFKVSSTLINAIRTPRNIFQEQLANNLPDDLKSKLTTESSGIIALDMEELHVSHNHKDSWEDWAPPFLYSILSDLQFRDKLKQAEISALDGVINVIRLWKLGDHKEGILPAEAAMEKLTEILESNTGGGAIDIIWDSMIEMKDFYPPIDKILGSEKYTQVNRDILIGLGVPEVLIGGEGANFSNSFIQLKTLKERLNYIRDSLKDWLNEEAQIVCDAMGFDIVPKIKFNEEALDDNNINKKLVLGLLDRGIVSTEAVLQVYGEDFLIEMGRIKSEKPILKNAGVKIKSPLDPTTKPKGNTGGRPDGGDNVGADDRTPKPRRSSEDSVTRAVFAADAIDAIDEYIIPIYSKQFNISNARQLTNEQKKEINEIRCLVLSSIKPDDDISEECILNIAEDTSKANFDIIKLIDKNISNFMAGGKSPTLQQRKRLESISWAQYYTEKDNGEF